MNKQRESQFNWSDQMTSGNVHPVKPYLLTDVAIGILTLPTSVTDSKASGHFYGH